MADHGTTATPAGGRSNFATATRTVFRDIGALQVLIGGSMLVPMLVSLLYRKWYSALAFLFAAGITAVAGGVAYEPNEDAPEPRRHHAMIVAALGWAVTAFFGAVPFVLAAYITPPAVLDAFVPAGETYRSSLLCFLNPLHAFFESMIGYTTTGLTMSVREPSVGHGFLWYRSQMQRIGGAGMIVLSLAVLRRPHGLSGFGAGESSSSHSPSPPCRVKGHGERERYLFTLPVSIRSRMYIVIVGAGNIGQPLIEIATRGGNEVVVVERNDERAEAASAGFDCLVINDDATVMQTLEDAGADRADAIISTTDQDATNVMVCLLAQEIGIPAIVSVVHDAEHMDLFSRIGVNTIENPQRLIAEYLYRAVERPSIVDYMRIGETAEVFEITVGEEAPIAGMRLQTAAERGLLDEDVLVVAIERENRSNPITPRGETTVEPGDLLTVYSAEGVTPEVTDVFGHYEDDA